MIPVAAVAASSTVNVRGRLRIGRSPMGVHRDQSQQQEKHDARLDEHQDIRQGSSASTGGTQPYPEKDDEEHPGRYQQPLDPPPRCEHLQRNQEKRDPDPRVIEKQGREGKQEQSPAIVRPWISGTCETVALTVFRGGFTTCRPTAPLLRDVGEKRQAAGPLDGRGELPLVLRACPGDPPRHDLSALGGEALQASRVLPVDRGLLDAELAHLPLEEGLVPAAAAGSRRDHRGPRGPPPPKPPSLRNPPSRRKPPPMGLSPWGRSPWGRSPCGRSPWGRSRWAVRPSGPAAVPRGAGCGFGCILDYLTCSVSSLSVRMEYRLRNCRVREPRLRGSLRPPAGLASVC